MKNSQPVRRQLQHSFSSCFSLKLVFRGCSSGVHVWHSRSKYPPALFPSVLCVANFRLRSRERQSLQPLSNLKVSSIRKLLKTDCLLTFCGQPQFGICGRLCADSESVLWLSPLRPQ